MDAEKYEHRRALKIQLQSLWATTKLELPKDSSRFSPRNRARHPAERQRCRVFVGDANKAQLLLLPFLSAAALKAQLARDVERVADVGIVTGKTQAALKTLIKGGGAAEAGGALREEYRVLLEGLQQHYISRRFRRDQRLLTAQRLLQLSALVVVIAVLPTVAVSWGAHAAGAKAEQAATDMLRNMLFGVYAAASWASRGLSSAGSCRSRDA